MSSFFKKLGKNISSPFKKGGAVSNVFKKGGAVVQGLSSGLKTVSQVLGKVGTVGGQILKSPITAALVGSLAPELAPEIYAGGAALVAGAKIGSKLTGTASKITDVSSYKKANDLKGHLENIEDASRRAMELQKDLPTFA